MKKKLGIEHPDTAATYNNIADVYLKERLYDEAIKYYKKAFCIREKKLGIKHPDTVSTKNKIAIAYLQKGDGKKYLEYTTKCT